MAGQSGRRNPIHERVCQAIKRGGGLLFERRRVGHWPIGDFTVLIVVVVPPRAPKAVIWIDRIIAPGTIYMAVRKQQVRAVIMSVTGTLIMAGGGKIISSIINHRIQVCIEIDGSRIRADIPDSDHVRGLVNR